MGKFDFINDEFERRRKNRQVRKLRRIMPLDGVWVAVDGVPMINFCSNDYLGLSRHERLIQRARSFMDQYGAGSTASRLICGNYEYFEEVEQRLARLKQTESALILNAGFQANATVIPVLCDRNTLILSDQLNHNSIINGCRLARCRVKPFAHNNLEDLEKQLQATESTEVSRRVIISETVFSMDGDVCDLDGLIALARKYDAILVVDEAHATGVVGENGMGAACGKPVDVVIGTFGKSGGSFGAYVACSADMKEFLVNCCPGFIYSTALPPAVVGEIAAALELIPQMDAERRRLHETADYLRDRLQAMGFSTGDSATQIIPVIVNEEETALALSGYLESRGFLAVAIRPPTVPPKKSRIRISLSALHNRQDVEALADAIDAWQGGEGAS